MLCFKYGTKLPHFFDFLVKIILIPKIIYEYPQTANVEAYRIRPDAPTYLRGRFRAYAIRPYRQFGKMRTFIK